MNLEGHDTEPSVLPLHPREIPPLAQVRQWTATVLAPIAEDHLDAVLLVCTELVTNAYEHGQGPLRIRLHRQPAPCSVRVEVDDPSPQMPILRQAPTAHRGRGLVLVDQLSVRWGTNRTESGKTVWAQISCEESTPDIAF